MLAIQAMAYWFLLISPLRKQGLQITHYRDFKTWCKSKKAQQKFFSISTRKAKMSSAFSPRLKSEFGIKKEDAHVFVAQKAGTFFLQSDYRNKGTRSDEPRGQPCMPHCQPVVLRAAVQA